MTRVSIVRRPAKDSHLQLGDLATLPQPIAQEWISKGWAVYADGERCRPGPPLPKPDLRKLSTNPKASPNW